MLHFSMENSRILRIILLSAVAVAVVVGVALGAFFLHKAIVNTTPPGGDPIAPYDRKPPPVGIQPPDWVRQDLLSLNPFSRPGDPLLQVNGVVVHYVANPGSSAQANRNYFAQLSEQTVPPTEETLTPDDNAPKLTYASSHFIIDMDGSIIQCVPLSEISYCSNQRNIDTIAIEVCHPDETGEFTEESYASLVRLTRWLCETYTLTGNDLLRHYDITEKLCPLYYVEHPSAWETFKQEVDKR